MSEIFSVVRLKERVLIIVAALALALFVGGAAGAITYATTDRHDHGYDYTLKRGEDGGFVLEGFCDYERCSEPTFLGTISSEYITEKVTQSPNCCAEGVMTYYFTWKESEDAEAKTYSYTEAIPPSDHAYVGNVTFGEDGSANVNAVCTNAGCTNKGISISGATEVELIETIPATCISDRLEKYSVIHNGKTVYVTKKVDEKIDHVLNGKPISDYLIGDGVYQYGVPGLSIVIGSSIGCGQTASAMYSCEVCEKNYTVTVGRPDHVLVYDEAATVLPDFENSGKATVKCVNDGCNHSITLDLPMVEEGVNAFEDEAKRDHVGEKRYVYYTFNNTEYNVNLQLEFALDWYDHVVEYVAEDTILPTFDMEGVAYVQCSYDGCGKSGHVIIPMIDLGEGGNAVIIRQATEQSAALFKYTYFNEEYNFTVEFEDYVGEKLSHNYVYELRDTDLPFQPKLYGKCDQPECSEPEIWLTDVPVTMREVEATCTHRAYIEFTCTYEGQTYTYRMREFGDYAHDFELIEGKTVYPTSDSAGKAVLFCNKAGCAVTKEITLPAVVIDENSDNYTYDEATNIEIVNYSYSFEVQGETYTVSFVYNREKPHAHTYDYRLEPSLTEIGKLDFVGICNFRDGYCQQEYREIAVDAELIEDTGTCTEPGYAIWEYVKDGVSYTYRVEGEAVAGHRFVGFDLNADTTRLPDFKTPGQIDIYCDICDEFGATVELPVMYIGVNSTIKAETSQQITYHYSVTITYDDREITVKTFIFGPNSHTLAFAESETVYPTLTEPGKAIFKCTDGGCTVYDEVELPVVVLDESAPNYSYDPETNIETVYYTYGFEYDGAPYVVEYTFERVKPHDHTFEYTLEQSATVDGGFDLVGHCTFRSCTEETREEGVAAELINDTSTCTVAGIQTWSYEKDGVEYTCDVTVEAPEGHKPTDYSVISKPTFDTVGSVSIICSACNEIVGTVELPAMLEGEEGNCTLVSDEGNQALYNYTVTVVFEENEITVETFVVIER